MPDAVISGGWDYVIPAYSITFVVLVAYVWSVFRRQRRIHQREDSGHGT